MRKYKNWAHKISSWEYLSEDLSCQFFPEHRVHHFCFPPWTPSGVLKVSAAAAHALILIELDTEKAMAPTPVLLPGESHGRRSLEGCSPWGCWGSDTTERLHFHFSLSCIGEGNGNPLQCSCLENPRDGGAWCAAVYGVTQSWTRLKWLSRVR